MRAQYLWFLLFVLTTSSQSFYFDAGALFTLDVAANYCCFNTFQRFPYRFRLGAYARRTLTTQIKAAHDDVSRQEPIDEASNLNMSPGLTSRQIASRSLRTCLDRRKVVLTASAVVPPFILSLCLPDGKAQAAEVWRRPANAGGFSRELKKAQVTFSDRFVTYLSRFLLNYEPSSVNWWRTGSQAQELLLADDMLSKRLEQFGNYAASVEIGLARFTGQEGTEALADLMARRYGSISREALKQVAFLFTLLDDFQPTSKIGEMLALADNCSIVSVKLQSRGSGYTGDVPTVRIETPDYAPTRPATAKARLRESGRILRINMLDCGSGYTKPPKVFFSRTIQISKDVPLPDGVSISPDQIDIPFKGPVAECTIENGKVTSVKVKDGGGGLFSGTYSLYFEAPSGSKATDDNSDVDDTVVQRTTARGVAVHDMEVDSIAVSDNIGFTPAYATVVKIQSPEECGGEQEGAKCATAQAIMTTPSLRDSTAPSLAEAAALGISPANYRIAQIDQGITALLPFSVRLSYSGRSFSPFVAVQHIVISLELLYFLTIRNFPSDFDLLRQVLSESTSLHLLVHEAVRQCSRKPSWKAGGSDFGRIGISGAICASLAHGALVPLDTVKVKLQTAPPGSYANVADAAYKIMTQQGGIKTFVNGFQPEFLGSAIYGFLSFGGTELLRRYFTSVLSPAITVEYPVAVLVVSSCLASTLAAIACCPFQAVKVRMVADDKFGPGPDMMGGFRRMVREDGWFSLIQGAPPYVAKDVTFVLSKFSVFDIVSKSIYLWMPALHDDLRLTLLVSLVSGTIAGTCAAVTSQPADYLFSKLLPLGSQSNEVQGATVMSAWNNYISAKDYGAVWRGIFPRLFYGGLLIALQFVIYDYCRVLFHVSPGELNVFLDVFAGIATGSGTK